MERRERSIQCWKNYSDTYIKVKMLYCKNYNTLQIELLNLKPENNAKHLQQNILKIPKVNAQKVSCD